MSKSNLAALPATNQYEIVVEVRPGSGNAAFFADVEFRFAGRSVKILGCPVWRGKSGELQPDLPTKPGSKNPAKRFPLFELDPDLLREVFHAIRVACEEYRKAEHNR